MPLLVTIPQKRSWYSKPQAHLISVNDWLMLRPFERNCSGRFWRNWDLEIRTFLDMKDPNSWPSNNGENDSSSTELVGCALLHRVKSCVSILSPIIHRDKPHRNGNGSNKRNQSCFQICCRSWVGLRTIPKSSTVGIFFKTLGPETQYNSSIRSHFMWTRKQSKPQEQLSKSQRIAVHCHTNPPLEPMSLSILV